MTRTVTPAAVKRIITKGLTGWEAGKLVLQDLIDCYLHRDSVLTDADLETIRHVPMEGADVRDYNMFMALCRGFHMGCILGEWTCADAGLEISRLVHLLQDARKRRTVELFESPGPHVVTQKQYEDIVAAQKQKKLKFEYSLAYLIEERFYAIAPPEAREEIEEICPDIESGEDFVSAIPEKYKGLFKQPLTRFAVCMSAASCRRSSTRRMRRRPSYSRQNGRKTSFQHQRLASLLICSLSLASSSTSVMNCRNGKIISTRMIGTFLPIRTSVFGMLTRSWRIAPESGWTRRATTRGHQRPVNSLPGTQNFSWD